MSVREGKCFYHYIIQTHVAAAVLQQQHFPRFFVRAIFDLSIYRSEKLPFHFLSGRQPIGRPASRLALLSHGTLLHARESRVSFVYYLLGCRNWHFPLMPVAAHLYSARVVCVFGPPKPIPFEKQLTRMSPLKSNTVQTYGAAPQTSCMSV